MSYDDDDVEVFAVVFLLLFVYDREKEKKDVGHFFSLSFLNSNIPGYVNVVRDFNFLFFIFFSFLSL